MDAADQLLINYLGENTLDLLCRVGQWDTLEKLCTRYLQTSDTQLSPSTHWGVYRYSAIIHAASGNPLHALQLLEHGLLEVGKLCETNPQLIKLVARYIDTIADCQMQLGDLSNAINNHDRALSLAMNESDIPLQAQILYSRALARLEMGDTEHGIADLRQALMLAAEYDALAVKYDAALMLASVYSHQGNQKSAVRYFHQVDELLSRLIEVSSRCRDAEVAAMASRWWHGRQLALNREFQKEV